MKYPCESAIQNHYLEAILPHPTFPQSKQFLKNRQFYRPDKFIWNNPHRASDQMYKFYHAYNDQYSKYKEPLVRKLQERDREDAESKRIHRLIAFRSKAREEFLEKQKNRELLESRLRNESIPATCGIRTDSHILSVETKYKSQSTINNDKIRRERGGPRKMQQSERIIKIEDAYLTGLKKYDVRVDEINRLIQEQSEDYHSKIRSEFATRKQNNDVTNSKFFPNRKEKGWKGDLE